MSGQPKVTGLTRALLRRMVAAAYRAGLTLDEIAAAYGTSPTTTYRLAREAGCVMRRRGPRTSA